MNSETKKLDNLLSAIVPLMEKVGDNKIHIDYNGSCDCGSADFQHLEDQNGEVIDSKEYEKLTASFTKISSRWTKEGWIEKTEETEQSLIALAEEIAYEMLANNAGGWEINAGSYGSVVIETSPVRVTLDHTPCDDVEDENGDYETVDLEEEVYFYSPKESV